MVLVSEPSFSAAGAAGRKNTSVLTSFGLTPGAFQNSAVSVRKMSTTTSQSSLPMRGAGELGVGAAHRRVLAVGEEALDLAVVHVHEHVLVAVGVGRGALGQPLVAELVVLGGGVAVEGLEQAHHELRPVDPEPALRRLLLEIGLEIGMRVAQRHRQVAGQLVVEQLEVGRALHVGVTAQRDDAAARPPDVAEEELQHAQRADVLDAVGVLGEVQRVGDGARSSRDRSCRRRAGRPPRTSPSGCRRRARPCRACSGCSGAAGAGRPCSGPSA